ncbi:ABC transporter permease [Pseudonocardia lacus]|uniref:ABC transporter permease n=1 Tax=Pseudonocardia lacus TaxID=2835865 RepID=UPI001BDD9741|nr:ABC transporter permease [Pseudonocardia lacus]
MTTWLIFRRSLRQSLRNPAWVLIGVFQPLVYLALFGPLLIPVVESTPGFPPGDAWQVFVPALVVQQVVFGTLFVGFGLIAELRAGVIDRMRVTPVSRTALLLGRALKDVVVLVLQSVLLVLIALPFGLRAPLGGVLLALALVAVAGLAMSCASYALALRLKSEEALGPVFNTFGLPLLLLSGVLLPLSVAPGWLFGLSRANPFAHIVEAERALFRGDLADPAVLLGAGATAVLLVLCVTWGIRTFHRESA